MTDLTSPQTSVAPETPQPRSAATFDVLPLSRELRETLAEIGYTHPTPVQIAVWEPATRGKDAVVQARTGTGKTAAFGMPIVDHIVRKSQAQVQALILTPTRELALQVGTEIERLGKRKNVKVACIYGGAPMQRQIDQLAEGAQVVAGTPGRVLDHLRRGTLDPKHVRLFVLDESDEMLSMGFERDVTAILDCMPKDRQTLLFSATVPPDIERLAKKLRAPEYLTLSGDHVGALEIEHFVYMVPKDKLSALVRMLEVESPESAVIFCNTKDETERVAQALSRQGFDAAWLNGDLPQSDREKVMTATRAGQLRFLVATDVAARDIDISHLTHVINHDFPQDAESYIHRTGRTGRAGRTGTAISLITPQDVGGLYLLRLTYKIRPIEKQVPSDGEIKTRAEADLVAMLAEAFTSRGVHPDDLAMARRLLTHDQCDLILAGLLRDHLGARPTARAEASAARRAPRAAPVTPPSVPGPTTTPAARAPLPASPRPQAGPPVGASAPVSAPAAAAPPSPLAVASAAAPSPVTPSLPLPPRPPPRPAPARPAVEEPSRAERPRLASPPRIEADAGSPPNAEPPAPRERPVLAGPPADARRPAPRGIEPRGGPGRRPRDGRGRDEGRPVSGTDGALEGTADPRGPAPQRHADFVTWQPPVEEGDDEPILGPGETRPAARGEGPRAGGRPRAPGYEPRVAAAERRPSPPAGAEPAPEGGARTEAPLDAGYAEIYVNVGRREGVRAADFVQLLSEKAGVDKANVRRIRVRDRNAFVSVPREDLARAIAALVGTTIGGRVVGAEQARSLRDDGPTSGPKPETGAASDVEPMTPKQTGAEAAASAAPAPPARAAENVTPRAADQPSDATTARADESPLARDEPLP